MIPFVLYLLCLVGANWAIQQFGLVPVGFGLLAPAGVFFAGAALTARDVVQEEWGRRGVLAAIGAGTALSVALSPTLALASGAAFLCSELADFTVYTPLRQRGWVLAVVASNLVGDVVDSLIFLWLAFGSLGFLTGQIVGKWETIVPSLLLMAWWRARQVPVTLDP